VVRHPRARPTETESTVDTIESSAPCAHPSTRKARTNVRSNLGRYRSLERRYFRGQLTLEEQQRFEALIYALRSLYKQAR
jgi:hypothetical protein